jgi:hypothetical protein
MPFSTSKTARFQAYQTRALMAIQIVLRVALWLFLGWFALTVYVIWYEAGQYFSDLGHEFFWRWFIGGLLVHTPTRDCPIPANGSWYPMTTLVAWLNGPQMYEHPCTVWLWYYGIRTALVPLGIILTFAGWRLLRRRVDSEHLRGLRLLTCKEHDHQLNGGWVKQTYRKLTHQEPGIMLGSVAIPGRLLNQHFVIAGSPGSGKSILCRDLLYQVQARGERAVVFDADAEFVQEFLSEQRRDWVLQPTDDRCPFWQPWLELRPENEAIDMAALAASLVRGRPRDDTQRYFHDNARLLLCGMFQVIKGKDRDDLSSFCRFLTQPRDAIRKQLEGTTAAPAFDPGAHDSGGGQGILSAANTAVSGFAYLPRRDQTTRVFSARQWVQEHDGSWLFLPSSTDARDAIEQTQGMWLDAIVRWLMAQPIGAPPTWIFCDELASLGYQKNIELLAVRGRKRNLPLVMGLQNFMQLRQVYGDSAAVTLLSAPSTKVVLRCDEAETAKFMSNLLGGREIERLQMSQLAGLSSYREGVTLQAHRALENIVLPSQIQLLPEREGYICIAGHDRTTISIPPRYLNARHPDFIPRNNTAASATTAEKDAQALTRWTV